MIDIGLYATMSGVDAVAVTGDPDLTLVHEGRLAEQLVGKALRACRPFNQEPALFTWVREARSSNAEVDYTEVIQFTGMTPTQLSRSRSLGLILTHAMLFMPRGLDPATLDHSEVAPRRRVKRTESAKA